MNKPYLHIQQPDKPLFPELVWSKPEGRNAGKLLIIGGNSGSFRAPAESYNEAMKTGIGMIRMILPASLQKTVGKHVDDVDFAPANHSGSFSQPAFDVWLEQTTWADGILLAGDFGRSSETSVLLEKFVSETPTPLTLTQDSLDSLYTSADSISHRTRTTLIPTIGQLQKLCKSIRFPVAITANMDLLHFIEVIHQLTTEYPANVVIIFQENTVVAVNGQVSSTKAPAQKNIPLAARCAVWSAQNPAKLFEALTTAVCEN